MPPEIGKLRLDHGWFTIAGLKFIAGLVFAIFVLGVTLRSYEITLLGKADAHDLKALEQRLERIEPQLERALANDSLQRELLQEIRQDVRDVGVDIRIMRGFICTRGNTDSYCRR
jgi:uncharacterized protein (UPF0335 family)